MSTTMKKNFKKLLIGTGLYQLDKRLKKVFRIAKYQMSYPPYGAETHKEILGSVDVIRHASLALAIRRLQHEQVAGAFAEVGVYKGELSRFIRALAPDRKLHLFDTFAGFPPQAMETPDEVDERFTDTSLEQVKRTIGDCTNIAFHQGYFPETAAPILAETFALVMLDMDKFKPTLAGLEIFYPRLTHGGYLFVHDYNSPESDYAVSRAVDAFFQDKPESIIELPDRCGSVLIRKV